LLGVLLAGLVALRKGRARSEEDAISAARSIAGATRPVGQAYCVGGGIGLAAAAFLSSRLVTWFASILLLCGLGLIWTMRTPKPQNDYPN
jgi:hypothetical protein